MNIATQCSGVMILLVLFLFYVQKKKLALRSELVFRCTFWVIFFCLCMDIASIIAIVHMDQLPDFFVRLVCKTYPVTLVVSMLFAFFYVYSDFCQDEKRWRRNVMIYSFIMVFVALMIYILPIYIYYDSAFGVVYTYGPSVLVTYAGALGLIMANLLLLLTQKNINPRRRHAVIIWMFMWIAAAVIQFFNNRLLVVGLAAALGIMVVYLQFENPELNLDRGTGMFNQGAYVQYMQQMYQSGKELPAMSIKMRRYGTEKQYADVQEQVMCRISLFLSSVPVIYTFRVAEDELLILFRKKDQIMTEVKNIYQYLQSGFQRYEGVDFRPIYIFTENIQIVRSGKELLELFHYACAKNSECMQEDYVEIDEETARQMSHRKNIELKIATALEQDRVVVFYQPIYSVKEQAFTSAEALVRIIDEDGTYIPPGEFIPIAEENGMIHKIGERVFEKVCRFYAGQQLETYGVQYIEVNLSTVQGTDKKLAEDSIALMNKYGISPKHINLEITESASASARNILLDNMNELMKCGVHFSLDDFGTGQSNLNYIVEMPVEIVKFDKDMIHAYFENGKAKYVMDAAMHMIQGLGLSIVAEGIETESQFQTMKALGIQYIQGFYFSKPLPEREYLAFVSAKEGVGFKDAE